MIDLSRLKPHCALAFWLGAMVLAVNVVLSALATTPILGWLPRTVTGTGYLEDSRRRVELAVQQYRDGSVDSNDHLVAIVGISGVRQGIELSVLAKSATPDWHFLGLGGAGLGIYDVAPYANLLLSSELRPDVVVLGIGVYQLLDTRPKPGSTTLGVLDYLRRGDFRNTATAIRDSLWVYSRRQDINLTVQSSVLKARAELFRLFRVALLESDVEKQSPWREMIKSDWPDHFSAHTLQEEEQFFADLGVFDRATYENAPKATSTFVGLIENFRRRGSNVVVLLMPEHSTLQRRIPPEAAEIVRRNLQSHFPANLPILDFRQSIDDGGFVDLAHLNRRGSLQFSSLLAKSMSALLPLRPSLMAKEVASAAP